MTRRGQVPAGRLMGVLRRLLAVLAAVLAVGLWMPPAAQAHTDLVSASPGPGAVLDQVPASIRLDFVDTLVAGVAQVEVIGPDGRDRVVGRVGVLEASLSAQLAALDMAGRYIVRYRVVAADGHPINGDYTFDVTAAAAQGAVGAAAVAAASSGAPDASWTLPALAGIAMFGVTVTRVRWARGRRLHLPEPALSRGTR